MPISVVAWRGSIITSCVCPHLQIKDFLSWHRWQQNCYRSCWQNQSLLKCQPKLVAYLLNEPSNIGPHHHTVSFFEKQRWCLKWGGNKRLKLWHRSRHSLSRLVAHLSLALFGICGSMHIPYIWESESYHNDHQKPLILVLSLKAEYVAQVAVGSYCATPKQSKAFILLSQAWSHNAFAAKIAVKFYTHNKLWKYSF